MLPTVDQGDLDPLEIVDQEEAQHELDGGGHLIEDLSVADPLIDPDSILAEDLEKIIVPEEVLIKKPSHMLPQEMIDRALEPDDLCDPGCI